MITKTSIIVTASLLAIYGYTKIVYAVGFIKGGVYVVKELSPFFNNIKKEDK